MWSLGVLIGGTIVALLALGILGWFGFALVVWVGEHKDSPTYGSLGFGWVLAPLAALLGLLLVAGFLYWPWSTQYHRWTATNGTVQEVSNRFLGDGKSTTQRFVVRFTDGRERSCDDTRCALVKAGDHLSLSCKRHWQFAGTDGWDCNYLGRTS